MLSNTSVVREDMVWDLTGQRLERVGRDVNRAALYEKQAASWPLFLLNAFSGFVFRRLARRFTDNAIWLRGIAQELRYRDAEISCDLARYKEDLGLKLAEQKNDLRKIREDLLAMQFVGVRTIEARSSLLGALSDLFESVEEVRWAVLESLADRAPRVPDMHASDVAALDALFRQMEETKI